MELAQMLTLSTSHITPATALLLDSADHPGVYQKGEHGYFISAQARDLPVDVMACLEVHLRAGRRRLALPGLRRRHRRHPPHL